MTLARVAILAAGLGVASNMVFASPGLADAHGGLPSRHGVIVWTNRADDGSEHLLIADADGDNQRALTASIPDTSDLNAQVSPRGNWIAYEHDTADNATIHLVRPGGRHDHVGLKHQCFRICRGADVAVEQQTGVHAGVGTL